MWRTTVSGLLAHKVRLVLTSLAVVLGVTFIAGTFVLTDTLHRTFSAMFGRAYQSVDLQVRGVAQLSTSGGSATRNPIPAGLITTVRRVPGVEAAAASVVGYAQFVAPDGQAIANAGAPTEGLAFDPDRRVSELRLIAGTPPSGPDDVVMDAGTASKYGFRVGDRVRVLLAGPARRFTITGLARIGDVNNIAGATLAAFSVPTAQRVLDEPGHVNAINVVTAPGAALQQVQHAIKRTLPPDAEVVPGQTVIDEQTSVVDKGVSFLSSALLAFGLVALLVGGFTIANTFSITVAQRVRELALLRVVGASRRQIVGSMLGEAAVIGAGSSAVGVGLGVAAALGLRALLRGFGIDLPSGPLVIEARTVLVALAVGLAVTIVAAVSPAWRAGRILPIAALAAAPLETEQGTRRRLAGGAATAAIGAAMLGDGLAKPSLALVGCGAAAIFVATAMLTTVLARPMADLIGRVVAPAFGVAGGLGRLNASRNPRRTAQTASALMVGLALVSAMAVFGASASRSARASVDDAINADLLVTSSSANNSGHVGTTIPRLLAGTPGVTALSTVYGGQFDVRGSLETLRALPSRGLSETVNLDMTAGSARDLADGELLVDTTTARADDLKVGDVVPVAFARTGTSTMRIGGIFTPNALVGSYVIGDGYYRTHFTSPTPVAVLLATDGSSVTERAVRMALATLPNVQVQSRAQFEKAQTVQVNQLLGLVDALLGLAVVIALIGIINSLLLSVVERTREIGLLRAVGMQRRQLRAMIRAEAVVLAAFGAVTGILLGTGLGVALVAALHSHGLTDTVVPAASLAGFMVVAAVLGLVAASWPARRAGRLDILTALSTT